MKPNCFPLEEELYATKYSTDGVGRDTCKCRNRSRYDDVQAWMSGQHSSCRLAPGLLKPFVPSMVLQVAKSLILGAKVGGGYDAGTEEGTCVARVGTAAFVAVGKGRVGT